MLLGMISTAIVRRLGAEYPQTCGMPLTLDATRRTLPGTARLVLHENGSAKNRHLLASKGPIICMPTSAATLTIYYE